MPPQTDVVDKPPLAERAIAGVRPCEASRMVTFGSLLPPDAFRLNLSVLQTFGYSIVAAPPMAKYLGLVTRIHHQPGRRRAASACACDVERCSVRTCGERKLCGGRHAPWRTLACRTRTSFYGRHGGRPLPCGLQDWIRCQTDFSPRSTTPGRYEEEMEFELSRGTGIPTIWQGRDGEPPRPSIGKDGMGGLTLADVASSLRGRRRLNRCVPWPRSRKFTGG